MAVWRGWTVAGIFLLWWIGGWSTTLAYRVRSAVLRVGDAGAERVTGDENAWRQALMHQAPIRIEKHTRLRLEVELEPFSSVPEQAMWVWQAGADRPAVATSMDPTPSWEVRWIAGERSGARLVFSGTPERLLSEVARVSIANVSAALLVVGGHDPSEPAMVWRMECSRTDTPIFTVDMRPTPSPKPIGIFDRSFPVFWAPRPPQQAPPRPPSPPAHAPLALAFAGLAVLSMLVFAVGTVYSGVLARPPGLASAVLAAVWQVSLGAALWCLVCFFWKWNLMQTLRAWLYLAPFLWITSRLLLAHGRVAHSGEDSSRESAT